ncbi:MAG: hypothetical protein EOR98_03135 [Mesorhizobium sp.]|nr:MAG: hypothetical protein EOR98_03135 [Mesorhizobium sp.]
MPQTAPLLEFDVVHAANAPGDISDWASDVVAKALVMRADAILVDDQADLHLTTLPTLPEDQAMFRQHANRLLGDEEIAGAPRAVVKALGNAADRMVMAAKFLDVVARRLDVAAPDSAAFKADLGSFSAQLVDAIDDVTGKGDVLTPLARITSHSYGALRFPAQCSRRRRRAPGGGGEAGPYFRSREERHRPD